MIRVGLPYHLRNLARVEREVTLSVEGEVTINAVLDALEQQFPMLRGTNRDHPTRPRSPLIRFFACGMDWSNEPADRPLPDAIASGKEPLRIIGAMAGG
jgi:hypothetical protein